QRHHVTSTASDTTCATTRYKADTCARTVTAVAQQHDAQAYVPASAPRARPAAPAAPGPAWPELRLWAGRQDMTKTAFCDEGQQLAQRTRSRALKMSRLGVVNLGLGHTFGLDRNEVGFSHLMQSSITVYSPWSSVVVSFLLW
ncbi:hypothetical protein EI94DRAFT_1717729, partial [Lactarius quietus]